MRALVGAVAGAGRAVAAEALGGRGRSAAAAAVGPAAAPASAEVVTVSSTEIASVPQQIFINYIVLCV